jgi:hypothetical protein
MIESATFTPVVGSVITFHDAFLPFQSFTTEVEYRQEELTRSLEHGNYDTYPFFGKRVLRVEGDLLATSSTDYWTRRLALLGAFDPIPGQRTLGTLDIEFTGLGHLQTVVSLDGYPELPIEALSPSAGKWMIAFKANDPYLYGPLVTETSVAKDTNKVLTSSGNAASRYLIATITGICHSPTILHTELNKTITLNNVVLGATDQLIFNFYTRTITQVTDSGATLTTKFRSLGDWFWLQKGATNTLKLTTLGNPVNEIQEIRSQGSGGTFTVTYNGQVTGNISYIATANDVKLALEALSNIAVNEVTVIQTTDSYPTLGGILHHNQKFTVEFKGTLAATNLTAMTMNGAGLTGSFSTTSVTTLQNGDTGTGTDTCTIVYTHKPSYLI